MFTELNRTLPWAGRRYSVNEIGEVFDFHGKAIRPYIIDGNYFVDLEWVLGKRPYLMAAVALVAYEKLVLPAHLLDEVEPLFVDGESTNMMPCNLLYRFKNGSLPVEDLAGFYYIPFYTNYAINADGVIMNIETRKTKEWSITAGGGPKNQTGGYYYTRTITSEGYSKVLFQHRALCMVFKPYESNVLRIVVNHLDGNPGNNKLDNIEWSTYAKNNQHAFDTGLRYGTPKILMKCLKTNTVQEFPSLSACARSLNVTSGYFIGNRLQNCKDKVFPDMLLFKRDDGTPWPEIDLSNVKICRSGGHGTDIVARNVFTGEKITFAGAAKGTALTGVISETIHKHARDNMVIQVHGWNFRYPEFASGWPNHSERHLKIYEKYPVYPPDGVVATDTTTGEELFFRSRPEAAHELKVKPAVVIDAINRKSKIKGKYTVRFFKLRENLGLPIE